MELFNVLMIRRSVFTLWRSRTYSMLCFFGPPVDWSYEVFNNVRTINYNPPLQAELDNLIITASRGAFHVLIYVLFIHNTTCVLFMLPQF